MLEPLLNFATDHSLSREQAHSAFSKIMSGGASEAEIIAFLRAMNDRGVTRDEIVGAAIVMRERATSIDISHINSPLLDTCGTGGDVKGTFNISTVAALIAAAAGATVVKHGNRSASGRSGSADVLEALGVNIDASPDKLHDALDRAQICFAFARSHHPAMRHVAAARKAIGTPTIFNLLGPLTNPAGAKHQLIGVFALQYTELLASVLFELGSERAWVVHGEDGLDELSTMSPTRVSELLDGQVKTFTLDARDLNIPTARLDDLRADNPAESAAIIEQILAGARGAPRDIAVLNAAAALVVAGCASDISDGLHRASAAVDDGRARNVLTQLIRVTNS